MRTQMLLVLLVVGAAAVAGFFVGRGTGPDPVPEPTPPTVRVAVPTTPEPVLQGHQRESTTPAEETPAAPPPEAPEGEVAKRAEAIRAQARVMEASAESTARRQVEAELTAERALLEDAERGGTMALLRRFEKDWTPPYELLGDAERYGALFERQTEGGTVDGRTFDARVELDDGDTIQYPPGRFELGTGALERHAPFPKDLSIAGYGMDETVLVLSDDLRVRSEVHSLTFRDLTLHCNDNSLERLRSQPYTLRLDKVRVIGFDNGAGGSKMLGGSVGAFYATDCRFEAGFGGSPGSGNLFDVRGALLARLENCDVVGPFRSVYYQWSGAAQLFVNCRFTRMRPSMRQHLEAPKGMARFEDCAFEYLPEEAATPRPKQRPLTDINPAWTD